PGSPEAVCSTSAQWRRYAAMVRAWGGAARSCGRCRAASLLSRPLRNGSKRSFHTIASLENRHWATQCAEVLQWIALHHQHVRAQAGPEATGDSAEAEYVSGHGGCGGKCAGVVQARCSKTFDLVDHRIV